MSHQFQIDFLWFPELTLFYRNIDAEQKRACIRFDKFARSMITVIG
jgi:hypothetical protein